MPQVLLHLPFLKTSRREENGRNQFSFRAYLILTYWRYGDHQSTRCGGYFRLHLCASSLNPGSLVDTLGFMGNVNNQVLRAEYHDPGHRRLRRTIVNFSVYCAPQTATGVATFGPPNALRRSSSKTLHGRLAGPAPER
jgi:hypothetical protein